MKAFRGISVRSILFAAIATASVGSPAAADHSWNGYHWKRLSVVALNLGDNLSPAWKPYLGTTRTDWSASTVIDLTIVAGQSNRNCRATNGRIEVCSAAYGYNGWLGVAQIWTDAEKHIVKGVTKLNDSYFKLAQYNTPGWRNLVMCQEVGHTIGLDHQDEAFDNPNLGTCMDYTNNPLGPPNNEHPNQHDFDQLSSIYTHTDFAGASASQTPGSSGFGLDQAGGDTPAEWGRAVAFTKDGRGRIFEKDLGGGRRLTTFVFWGRLPRGDQHD